MCRLDRITQLMSSQAKVSVSDGEIPSTAVAGSGDLKL
jgi:hypothetical protein